MRFNVQHSDAAFTYLLVIIYSHMVGCDTCCRNELLSPTPLCCEPTCTEDCASASTRRIYKSEPTCVCLPGFVRHKGRCIRKICCPKNVTDCNETPPTTCIPETTTVAPEPRKILGPNRKKLKYSHKASYNVLPPPENSSKPEIYVPENTQLIYVLAANAYPVLFYKVESAKQPPCFGSKLVALQAEKDPKFEYPAQCSCECTSKVPPITSRYPKPKKGSPYKITPAVLRSYEAKPPKCNRRQGLTFCRPCCVPTCENDCSNVRCSKSICVAELNCVCLSGYVLHNGQCIRMEECPLVEYDGENVLDEEPVYLQTGPEEYVDDYVEVAESETEEHDCCDEC